MYFITLTRKLGTHGSAIARRVADELHYSLYDTEAIETTAQELGFLDDVREIDEKAPSVLQRLFSHQPEIYLGSRTCGKRSLQHNRMYVGDQQASGCPR